MASDATAQPDTATQDTLSADLPAIDTASQPDNGATAVAPDVSAAQTAAAPVDHAAPGSNAVATAARKSTVDVLEDEFSDVEELARDGWYDDLKPEQLKQLDTVSRRFLHNVRLDVKAKLQALVEKEQASATVEAQRQAALDRAERDLLNRQAEFAELFNRPDVKAALTPAADSATIDPLTPEGQASIIERKAQEAVAKAYEPLQKAAREIQARAKYAELLDRHPEMREPTFKAEVHGLWRSRQGTPAPITPEDAVYLVKAQRSVVAETERKNHEQRARASAALHVQRNTASGAGDNGEIPKGIKGAAVYRYFEENPQAHAAYLRRMGRTP